VRESIVFWWALLTFGVVALFLLIALFHWISREPGIEAEEARVRFHAEQDYRALRRSGELSSGQEGLFKS
jgi:hypothetical protein